MLGSRTMLALVCAGLMIAALPAAGCDRVVTLSGTTATQTRDIESVDRVSLRAAGELKITPSKSASLKVTADKNLLPYIRTKVEGGQLIISLEPGGRIVQIGQDPRIEYDLRLPSIKEIDNSGSGQVVGGPFSGGLLTLLDSGSGSIELGELNVLSLSSTISGSGSIDIRDGLAAAQEVNVSGSGSYEAPDLESRVATVKVSGSGSVEIWATEGLDATVTGSGSIAYWGSPSVTEEKSGSGSIEKRGDKPPSTSE